LRGVRAAELKPSTTVAGLEPTELLGELLREHSARLNPKTHPTLRVKVALLHPLGRNHAWPKQKNSGRLIWVVAPAPICLSTLGDGTRTITWTPNWAAPRCIPMVSATVCGAYHDADALVLWKTTSNLFSGGTQTTNLKKKQIGISPVRWSRISLTQGVVEWVAAVRKI
jgi:hypothetical protein